jgi:hypothetical protein
VKALRQSRDTLEKLLKDADALRADGKEKLCKVKYLQFARQVLSFLVELEKFAYRGGYLIYKLEAFLEVKKLYSYVSLQAHLFPYVGL